MRKKFPFILLAGSPEKRDSLMEYADVDYKVTIEINDKPMINYVLDALIASDCVSYILITGVPENLIKLPDTIDRSLISFHHLEGPMVDKLVEGSKKLLEISKEKPEIFPDSIKKAIITTGDIPALTPKAIHDFIDATGESNYSDVFYHSMVSFDVMEATFPSSGRSFMHLRDISLCGGDLDMVDLPELLANYPILKKLTENRKTFILGLFRFSPITVIRYIFKRVRFEETPDIMGKLLTVKSRIIPSPNAVIGMDVDKPHQLEMMKEYFSKVK